MRKRMVKCSVVALYGLLLSLQGLLSVNAGVTSDYRRPPSRPLLPMEHELLARPIGASPHVPEQVHLSLAGPGSMAVSWLTYPQDDPANAGLLNKRRTLLKSDDDDDDDEDEDKEHGQHYKADEDSEDRDSEQDDDEDDGEEESDRQRDVAESDAAEAALSSSFSGSRSGSIAAHAEKYSDDEGIEEDDEDSHELGRHHKRHHKHHHKKHRKDRQQCRYMEGLSRSIVKFGTSSGDYLGVSHGNNTCYQADEYVSGALHHVVLGAGPEGPLQPDTTYFYTCGDPDLGMSPEFSFRTPPVVGPESLPYRLGLIGDLGQTDNSASTLDHLTASNPGSVINVGDLSYADGYQPRWDTWGRLIASHTSSFPWAVIEGNHEEEVTNGKTGFLAYESRFWFPSEQSRSYSPFYYSYEVAGAHVLMLGCYVEYGRDSEQFAWLQQDLASVDRSRTPWVIVGMHAPWYNSNTAHQHEVDDMMDAMEETLYQHGVDAVFAGHVHAYESSYPVFRGVRDECGPVHIVIGDGGNREGLAEVYDEPQPDWSAYREASYGSGTLDLLNTTHALWRWHRNQDSQAIVSDEVWLVRNTTCRPSGLAGKAEKVDEAAPLQAAVQQGEQLLIGLARKFLRSGAAFLGAT